MSRGNRNDARQVHNIGSLIGRQTRGLSESMINNRIQIPCTYYCECPFLQYKMYVDCVQRVEYHVRYTRI